MALAPVILQADLADPAAQVGAQALVILQVLHRHHHQADQVGARAQAVALSAAPTTVAVTGSMAAHATCAARKMKP